LQQWVERHLDEVVSAPVPSSHLGDDAEMRHGRQSRWKRFDGDEEHLARDLDFPAIVACAVTPAETRGRTRSPEQRRPARHRGARRNLFALRRAATIQNLEGLQRMMREAA
jgi:hypothetical protein